MFAINQAVERLQRAEKESESSLKDRGVERWSFRLTGSRPLSQCKLIGCSALSQSGNEATPILIWGLHTIPGVRRCQNCLNSSSFACWKPMEFEAIFSIGLYHGCLLKRIVGLKQI